MAQDGVDGLLALREAGVATIAEDEASCVVFGIAKEAIARGGAVHVVTLFRMPGAILDCLEGGGAGQGMTWDRNSARWLPSGYLIN